MLETIKAEGQVTGMKIDPRNEYEAAKEYAYRILKKNIITLELEPGSALNDMEISRLIGISRTPVREAIIRLREESDIIEVFPQKGMCIAKIDTEVIQQVRFLRMTLEKAVVELACGMAQEEDLARLDENLKLQEFYVQNQMFEKFFDSDNMLHKMFFTICNKELVYHKSQGLEIHYDRVRNMEMTTLKDSSTLLKDHILLVQAIRDQDKTRAGNMVEHHLDRWLLNEKKLREKYPQYFK